MTLQPEYGWGFSTLGCPGKSLKEVFRIALDYGFDCFEIRGLSGSMDLPKILDHEFGLISEADRERARKMIVALNSGFSMTKMNSGDYEKLSSWLILADRLGVPCVRVFGGGEWGEVFSVFDWEYIRDFCCWWEHFRDDHNLKTRVALETHSAFSSSEMCLKFLELAKGSIPIIWDSHHTFRLAGETPEYTWSQLGEYVCHVHVKDSIMVPSARHDHTYVLPGEGDIPVKRILGLLSEKKYRGKVSLEWEKQWHPYLPNLEIALAAVNSKWKSNGYNILAVPSGEYLENTGSYTA